MTADSISFDHIKQNAKKFMTTQEIKELGLVPDSISAGEYRKIGLASWVPAELPDCAKGASFSVGSTDDPKVLETIVIWNSDTFNLET
jgi:hypothetical protein